MTTAEVVLAELRDRYVTLPRGEMAELAEDIARKVHEHLHDTGALSCPPGDLR